VSEEGGQVGLEVGKTSCQQADAERMALHTPRQGQAVVGRSQMAMVLWQEREKEFGSCLL
jgi:hypothetical protein